jgi:hypothetical protein
MPCVSESTMSGTESLMSMKLLANICGKEVLISLDSCSSATFLSSNLVVHVPGTSELSTPVRV